MMIEQKKGYTIKTKGAPHPHRLEFFCPVEDCRRITSTIDDKYLLEYGVCATCYVLHIENRQTPTIDVTKYKKTEKT